MTELLTSAQMRAIEKAAIDSGAVTGRELMERAGEGVVAAIFEEWPEYAKAPQRVVVLCGPGNNGGDGFVIARLLKKQHWDAEVFLYGDPDKLPPDARMNYVLWTEMGAVRELTETAFRRESPPADLYVDAVFGTGLTRPVTGEIGTVLRHIAGSGGDNGFYQPRLVAVDVPSGLCADSGKVLGGPKDDHPFSSPSPFARLTVTFDSPKLGHFLAHGPAHCGKLAVNDIGVSNWRVHDFGDRNAGPVRRDGVGGSFRPPKAYLLAHRPRHPSKGFDETFGLTPAYLKKANPGAHKYHHGHALVLSGGVGKGGAARLAARGALRIGAGLVTVGAPPPALAEHAAQLNAIMVTPVADSYALSGLLKDARFTAICLGPGLGVGEGTRDLVRAALAAKRATVLDADALTAFRDHTDTLFGMLHDNCVLTPHGGEFARLFPDIAERLEGPKPPVMARVPKDAAEHLQFMEDLKASRKSMDDYLEARAAETGPAYSKADAAREAAKRAGCTVLLKGPDTVIAHEIGVVAVNSAHYDRAAPWLATAGSGDVLAGFIAGLLAKGLGPRWAADLAAWLHVECARSFGPGLIAEDLPEELPKVFRTLGPD
ncbi:MAG: NAD(P)H-hydrate epimerase [Pseudomonadota bacterium]